MGDYLRREPRPEDGAVTLWVVYERPRDYPHGYVTRRHRVLPTGEIWIDPIGFGAGSLEEARGLMPSGLVNVGRQPGDEPQIKEVWI